MYGKCNMETYIIICKIDSQWGICCMAQETQTRTPHQPRGVSWGGRLEGESKERGYMYTFGVCDGPRARPRPRGATRRPRAGVVAEGSYPASEVRSRGCALLEQL